MALITASNTHGHFGLTLIDKAGNSMQIDLPADQGGSGKGMRPMQTMLSALIGCSGADVISILKRQRLEITSFKMEVDGEREQGKAPTIWKEVHVTFLLEGPLEPSKVYRAADLSINKYCSVAETMRRAGGNITFSVIVNGTTFQP